MRKSFDAEKKNEKCCHIICYESEFWLKVEKKYDAEKYKYYNVLKIFKKCWKYLYEI